MADEIPRRKLYVIDNSVLDGLAASDRVTNLLPFLRGLRRQEGRLCNSCGSDKQARIESYESAKSTIVGLSSDKKQKFKEILNTKHARVVYRSGNRKIEFTF